MSLEFNKRVDKSVEYLHDHFNHKEDHVPVTREELKEVLTTVLQFVKEDDKYNRGC